MDLTFFTALVYLGSGIILFLLSFLIFREDSSQHLNRITGAMLLMAGLGPMLGAFGLLNTISNSGQKVDLEFLNRFYVIWELFFPQLVLFSLHFPVKHPVLKRHPYLPVFLFAPQIIHFALLLFLPGSGSIENIRAFLGMNTIWPALLMPLKSMLSTAIDFLAFVISNHRAYFSAINMTYVLTAIAVMHYGSRKIENPRLLQQVRWIIGGIGLSLGLYAAGHLVPEISQLNMSRNLTYLLSILSVTVGSISIAWAVIRYQFLDVRLILRRGFLYSVSTGLIIAVYLQVYDKAKSVIQAAFGSDWPLIEILFLLVAVIAFQPILSAVENLVSKVLRDKREHSQVLEKMSQELLSMMSIAELQRKVADSLSRSLWLERAYLLVESEPQAGFSAQLLEDAKSPNESHDLNPPQPHFATGGNFIEMMRSMELPIHMEDLVLKITNGNERDLLVKMRASLLMPLSYRGELVGILVLGRKLNQRTFSYQDMTLLRLLSRQIAAEIENARLYQQMLAKQRLDEELNVAREIQKMLLPRQMPKSDTFEISAINDPSLEVGGDVYDFVDLNDGNGSIGVAIGDIAGKGIPGAILMSNLLAAFRACSAQEGDPSLVMQRVNDLIAKTSSPGKYATFLYGLLDATTRHFQFCNAGHNYPIVMQKNSAPVEMRFSDLIVGARSNICYRTHHVELTPGEFIVLYTDGITEAMNAEEEEFGITRLLQTIEGGRADSSLEMRSRIHDAVLSFAAAAQQADDLTLVVIKLL